MKKFILFLLVLIVTGFTCIKTEYSITTYTLSANEVYQISLLNDTYIEYFNERYIPNYKKPYIQKKLHLRVTATMYHPTIFQCDDTPTITASGLNIDPLKVSKFNYIAISRNLHVRYGGMLNFYDTVYISNAGHKSNDKYIIVDLMNKRWKNKIDFLESLNTPIYKYENVVLAYNK